jgi:AcrR family transcriptional regulator
MQDSALSTTQEHRSRLLRGMAQSVAEKGYADTTIADVVREAGVSRRTFYEHFGDKAGCFIALYEAASRNALQVLRESIDPAHRWEEQVERAIGAYLQCMAGNPLLMRTLFIEILGLGPEGLVARRRVHSEIAQFVLGVVNGGQGSRARKAPLSPGMAMALVGGINELILQSIEQERGPQLMDLVGTSSQFVRAVTGA